MHDPSSSPLHGRTLLSSTLVDGLNYYHNFHIMHYNTVLVNAHIFLTHLYKLLPDFVFIIVVIIITS
jgi:hypothetical protein